VGAFVEGELHLSCPFFPAHRCILSKLILAFILFYSFIAFLFSFCSRANQGTLPWCGDQWWQRYPQVLSQK
jgi:hypothetical protein